VKIYPNQLSNHLQKLAPIYWVFGDEPLIKQESLTAIRQAAEAQGYQEREVLEVNKSFNWQNLPATDCFFLGLVGVWSRLLVFLFLFVLLFFGFRYILIRSNAF